MKRSQYIFLILVLIVTPSPLFAKEIQSAKDQNGVAPLYTDNPDLPRAIVPKQTTTGSNLNFEENKITPTPEDDKSSGNAPKDQKAEPSLKITDGINFSSNRLGRAVMSATIQNVSKNTVGKIKLTAYLYDKDKKLLDTVNVAIPNRLKPGESLDVEHNLTLTKDEIISHNFDFEWSDFITYQSQEKIEPAADGKDASATKEAKN